MSGPQLIKSWGPLVSTSFPGYKIDITPQLEENCFVVEGHKTQECQLFFCIMAIFLQPCICKVQNSLPVAPSTCNHLHCHSILWVCKVSRSFWAKLSNSTVLHKALTVPKQHCLYRLIVCLMSGAKVTAGHLYWKT